MNFEEKINDLALNHKGLINEVLIKHLKICVRRKWVSNDTVQFYGFTYGNLDDSFSYEEAKTRIMASEETKNAIYNLWMDMYR